MPTCSNCGDKCCNGIDCYYRDEDDEDDVYSCPICKRDCCEHFGETLTELAQAKDRIMDLEEALKEEVDENYKAQARIQELVWGLVREMVGEMVR